MTLNDFKKYDTISFALEGVLDKELDGSENPMQEEMQKLCRELVNNGKRVVIYTKRYERNDNKYLSIENKYEYKSAYELSNKLGVSDIVFTNRNPFHYYMNNDSYQCHLNCSNYETLLIKTNKPSLAVINVNAEIWNKP
jgi:phosphosulfolactate synthase (CoM biosynthesis protein A)